MDHRRKWKWCLYQQSKKDSKLVGRIHDTPQYYINTLKVELSVDVLARLRANLSSQPLNWQETIGKLGGFSLLVDIVKQYTSK